MKIRTGFIFGLFLLSISLQCLSQGLNIKKATSSIIVDGVMEEVAWQSAEIAKDFHQKFPYDSSLAIVPTEVRMTYDDENIYIIAVMKNNGPREYVASSLRRDFRGPAFDGFTVVLDTYKDKANAFLFGVNPYGVQREGLISNGGVSSRGNSNIFSLTWDNKWIAEAKIYEDKWIAEMAIPFKTLRFKADMDSWNINFYRIDSDQSEQSTWAPIPRNFILLNLAFNKELIWDKPLKSTGKNISLIPYGAFKTLKDFEDPSQNETKPSFGGDAKIALSSAMNLDLTINPDFSQVEADVQVTNLDRFEIFFPEQRQFFLENADLFASYGTGGARPFFSRRIGLAKDTATGTNIMNPLYLGARMSGNINNRWRTGLMTVQASEEQDLNIPTFNYTVASVQRRFGQRSNVSAILVNKQAFQDSVGGEFNAGTALWNRTFGLDINLATPDNRWSGKGYYHHSMDSAALDSTFSMGAGLSYKSYKWEFNTDFRTVGANFNPEVGFVRRNDFSQYRGTFYRNFYPNTGKVQSHAPGFDFDIVTNPVVGTTDWDVNLLYRINFKSNASFNMRLRRQFTYLFEPFDPTGSDGPELPENSNYAYNFIIASYSSDPKKKFTYRLSTRSGQYFNGTRLNLQGTFSYRFFLKGIASLNFAYNSIKMPEGYNDSNLYLIGPRVDLTFTRKIFWTTFIQYNSQIDNLNINTRLQWRFKPVSDLFIVYTDNYYAGIDDRWISFNQPRLRAFVVKLTYWINL